MDTLDTIEREIATTPAEFRRGLSLAFPGKVAEIAGGLRVDGGTVRMDISLVAGEPRVIALLRLPTLHVAIRFSGGTAARQRAMLDYMDLAMQRGGG